MSALAGIIPRQLVIANNEYLTLLVLVIGLALVVLALNVAVVSKKSSKKKNTVLITGLQFAGKTAIYYKIRNNKAVETVTSIKENEADVSIEEGKIIHLVDIPGHERLRFKFSEFMPIAGSVVFVIDSATIGRHTRQAAEYLYDILAHKISQKEKTPVLIACNKSDLLTAFKKDRIQTLLEGEMNKLRQTRTAALDTQDAEENETVFLGFEGQDFSFLDLENEVEFIECSVERDDIDAVREWVLAKTS
ncbi:hypothetical protein DFQ27_002234 [Actinomortierella ambigua]|uniref:Signal recognition particle receptor subunit beta n=1 Tax=Actinomortierella ambigua TaxID=1343610 RepID=A0A9P6Q7X8_9FUNG|nr:hypothetical protein DFQ26_001282 [Actinomortierella ambigua]KAG0262613.1 hypothetical protein DFQ27_002234 [Actinomortierella ambigua]